MGGTSIYAEPGGFIRMQTGAQYEAVVGSLAIHTLVGHSVAKENIEYRYIKVFQVVLNSLKPGGHFIMADHVELLPVYRQLQLMEVAGFTEVDVAWREQAYFIAGGRKKATAYNLI